MLQTDALLRGPRIRPRTETEQPPVRLEVKGKFLFAGDETFFVKGVSYGAFGAEDQRREDQDFMMIESDFGQVAANGFNAVRLPHTTPLRPLLAAALPQCWPSNGGL